MESLMTILVVVLSCLALVLNVLWLPLLVRRRLWRGAPAFLLIFLAGAACSIGVTFFSSSSYLFLQPTSTLLGSAIGVFGGLVATGIAAAIGEGIETLFRWLDDRDHHHHHHNRAEWLEREEGGGAVARSAVREFAAPAFGLAAQGAIMLAPALGGAGYAALTFIAGAVQYLSGSGAIAPPVYNARAVPNAGAPDALLDRAATQLFFNIGPASPQNMIGSPELSPRLSKELDREKYTELTVTMTCYVCDNTLPQTKFIRYSREAGESTAAQFAILPDREVAQARNASSISFSVRSKGVEFDFLNVPVRIQRPGETANARKRGCPVSLADPGERPDLIIQLANDPRSGLKVGFDVNDATLAQRLAKYELKEDGSARLFDTRAITPDAVTAGAGKVYESLKKLVKPDALTEQQRPDVTALAPAAQQSFDENSERQAVWELHQFGIYMYDKLFLTENLELPGILKIIEKYGSERSANGKNLRVLIYTNAIYLPWQLLHAEGKPDADEFWGNKYILGVIPADPKRGCGPLPGLMRRPEKDEVLYAHYWQEVSRPRADGKSENVPTKVSLMGERLGTVLGEAFPNGVNVVNRKDTFKTRLKGDRKHLQVLWTFIHGHSGQVAGEVKTPDGTRPINLQEIAGQRLDFSQAEFIAAHEIDMETIQKEEDPRFFVDQPFVFLNGCETGTEGTRGTTESSLPGVFISRGARGVVATEAPVWDDFGYNFGETFLQKLTAGNMDAGQAMLATRREYLREYNNPLGLLYSYYGNAAARFPAPGK
jgi:hypothetical protein